jgi:predicted GIY-YIG superfamily endonuclease
MAKIADATFAGVSGAKHTFEVYAVGTTFNAVGAVYIFTKRTLAQDGTGVHTFVYIGQTGNLSERFDNHHKAQCITNKSPNCICVQVENNEQTRRAIETDLCRAHRTPCND